MKTMIKYDITTVDELVGTLKAGFTLVYGKKFNNCVVPTTEGYIEYVTDSNDASKTHLALILFTDQDPNGVFGNRSAFESMAFTGRLHGDLKIRLMDVERAYDILNLVEPDEVLYAVRFINIEEVPTDAEQPQAEQELDEPQTEE